MMIGCKLLFFPLCLVVFCPMRLNSTVMWTYGEIEMIWFLFLLFPSLSGVISQKVKQIRANQIRTTCKMCLTFCTAQLPTKLFCIVVNTTDSHVVGRAEMVAGHVEHYSYCRHTWAATCRHERASSLKRFSLFSVPLHIVQEFGGEGGTRQGKWNVGNKSPETWDQSYFYFSFLFFFALVLSRCVECFYPTQDATYYIQNPSARRQGWHSFLYGWVLPYNSFFIHWDQMEHSGFCYVFLFCFCSLHGFVISQKYSRSSSSPLCLYCEQTALLTWHTPGCYVDRLLFKKKREREEKIICSYPQAG